LADVVVGQVAAQDLAAAADRRGVASHTPGPSNDAPLQKESYQKQLKRLVNRLKSLAPEGVLLAVLDLANQKLGYHSAPPTTTTTHTPPSLQKLPPRATEKQMRDVLNIMVGDKIAEAADFGFDGLLVGEQIGEGMLHENHPGGSHATRFGANVKVDDDVLQALVLARCFTPEALQFIREWNHGAQAFIPDPSAPAATTSSSPATAPAATTSSSPATAPAATTSSSPATASAATTSSSPATAPAATTSSSPATASAATTSSSPATARAATSSSKPATAAARTTGKRALDAMLCHEDLSATSNLTIAHLEALFAAFKSLLPAAHTEHILLPVRPDKGRPKKTPAQPAQQVCVLEYVFLCTGGEGR
jgi:hypothetical protein